MTIIPITKDDPAVAIEAMTNWYKTYLDFQVRRVMFNCTPPADHAASAAAKIAWQEWSHKVNVAVEALNTRQRSVIGNLQSRLTYAFDDMSNGLGIGGYTDRKMDTRIEQMIRGLHGVNDGSYTSGFFKAQDGMLSDLYVKGIIEGDVELTLNEVLPISYNPLTNECDPSFYKPVTFAIITQYIKCEVLGVEVDAYGSRKTVYDTYISNRGMDQLYSNNLVTPDGVKWGECGHSGSWVRSADMIEVINRRPWDSYYMYSGYNPMPSGIFKGADGKLYAFDPAKYPYFIIGRGWSATTDGAIQLPNGRYLDLSDEPVFEYDTDVTELMDCFKSKDYEETHMGDKIAARNTLFMGVELEVEMSGRATMDRDDAATEAWKTLNGDGIVVHDGSLDNGFEMVSIPATLNYHYDIWERVCRSDLRSQIVSFMRESCGLHIHMSKECFTSYTLGMFITFINSTHNKEFIDVISQRRGNSYCARRDTKVSRGKHRDRFTDAEGGRHDKYWATNLQNEATVEVRMFKGTLAFKGVMKSLEFCHALHKYVTFHAAHNKLQFEDFLTWLVDRKQGYRKVYPFLYEYLLRQKYIKADEVIERMGDLLPRDPRDKGDDGSSVPPSDKKYTVCKDKLEIIRKANGERKKRA